jgi:calcium-dependent protein kinase
MEINRGIVENLKKYRGTSILKKAAMNVLVKHLAASQVKDLQKEFESIDKDMSGFLELDELVQAIKKANVDMKEEEIKQIVKEVDYAENGRVNYSEFIAATINTKNFLSEQKLMAIFQSFDLDDTGFITINNLKDSFSKFGRELTDHEIEQIMAAHDTDKDRSIDFQEFKLMMTGEKTV